MIKLCFKCRGTGRELLHENFTTLVKEKMCKECCGTGKYWLEVFEDEITISDVDEGVGEVRFKLGKGDLMFDLLRKYFGIKYNCLNNVEDYKKVKIKARKGAILIERV